MGSILHTIHYDLREKIQACDACMKLSFQTIWIPNNVLLWGPYHTLREKIQACDAYMKLSFQIIWISNNVFSWDPYHTFREKWIFYHRVKCIGEMKYSNLTTCQIQISLGPVWFSVWRLNSVECYWRLNSDWNCKLKNMFVFWEKTKTNHLKH